MWKRKIKHDDEIHWRMDCEMNIYDKGRVGGEIDDK
jgi:hypothetical protein